ncbi:aspartyl/glutamyl-tRNA amidotransferase subunit A [Anoxybacter fermentans]|uniref:Glutamyl-tRNA(Gln) amidotransferase subunit A n=1 Tax=Anoxybacter fermentans TaxID=1323375 RepID=A0A3Q9HNP4_9FIRM|nr:Asp-tRNA(Asn)/Glu-tRNA(Gln) amidotransferase subunit GatA [Anoxybacter fermentans]AZR72066.1 aspartyl/glutamyl-tRNA amidotransferase subunit A [Anoxybacter fermentans]
MALYFKTAHELRDMIWNREISVEELINAQFERIEEVEDKVKSYVTLNKEGALKKARELDEVIGRGEELGDLTGIPIAIKDNICTKGIRTTCSSRILENFIPPYNATVVEKLEKANTVMIGKTNLDEFAMGSSTENSAFFPTHNPWDLERVPGGSSGGSAAAVASGEAVISLGSDTGGSIRQPAAFCGIVGMKPTYGFVSRYGLVAFASSLDQIGPFTRDVTDCALVMNYLAGHDDRDSTSALKEPEDFTKALVADVKGLNIGVPKEYFGEGIDTEIINKINECIKLLVKLGADAEEVSMPHTEAALPAYYIIAPAEASSNLARYDGVRYGYRAENTRGLLDMYNTTRSEGFGPEVKRRIMLGTYALSSGYYDAYYLKAQKVRTLIKDDFDRAFSKYDVLISPTTPTTAFKLGENVDNPLAMYMSDICTVPINLAGVPAISIPVGFDSNGLPIGLQIIGKHFAEATILRVAYTLEQELRVKDKHPVLG